MLLSVTSHAFHLTVEVNSAWQVVDHQILGRGYFYGTALLQDATSANGQYGAPDGLVVFHGGSSFTALDDMRFVRFDDLPPETASSSRPVPTGVSDVHQIAAANGGVYVANTKHNSVLFQNLDGETLHEYAINGLNQDVNHVNSVYPCGRQIFALLHNRGKRESELLVLHHDANTGFQLERVLGLWHTMCHNVFVDEQSIYYNASPSQSFVAIDLAGERVAKEIPFPGRHTKGMAVTDEYVIIGLSDHTLNHLRRSRTEGRLAVIDRRKLELVAMVDLNFPDLPQPIGNINEVRILSNAEQGHARATPVDAPWSELKLGAQNQWAHGYRRMKFRTRIQLSKVKRQWEKWDVKRNG